MSYVEITVNHDAYVRANFLERPENWKPLNLAQANALYEKHAVMVDTSNDGVYFPVAYQLFGWRACGELAHLIMRKAGEPGFNYGYMRGEYSYFTFKGIREIVCMLNREWIEEAGAAMNAANLADIRMMDERDNAEEEAKKQARREKAAKRKAAKLAAAQAAEQEATA